MEMAHYNLRAAPRASERYASSLYTIVARRKSKTALKHCY